jgi:putative restriction endonuclease
MCGKIDCYLKLFANLRTDKNRNRWTAATAFQAPHKPFLLLSILDLVAQHVITSEFIEASFELAETFAQYWQRVLPFSPTGKMAYPFFHMSGEPFWKLVPRPSVQPPTGRVISSMKKIREIYLGAKLDKELMPLLFMEPLRERLRATLITTYFAPEVQPSLLEQSLVNYGAYQYSKSLLQKTETAELPLMFETEIQKKQIRVQGFRKAIVALYEHRCSLCGIRMLTPDGHTAVEAAHIIPWSENQNDRPTNGLALCRLCHWSFDEGLMGVGKNYEVLVSPQVKREPNFPGHMLTLSDRPIFRPKESIHWPGQDNIEWHRKQTFRR